MPRVKKIKTQPSITPEALVQIEALAQAVSYCRKHHTRALADAL